MGNEAGPVVMVLQQASSYRTQLAAGLGAALEEASVPLLVHVWGPAEGGPPQSLARLLTDGHPQAVVITALSRPESDAELAALLDASPARPRLHLGVAGGDASVRADNARGMRLVAEHLVQGCGARRILVVQGIEHHLDSQERLATLTFELARLGAPVADGLVVSGLFDREAAYRVVREALERDPGIDAVAAFNDRSALRALDAAHALGLDVPGDLVVTGFDDEDFAALCRPGLTTVSQSPLEQGRTAGRLVLQLLAGQEAGHVLAPVRLQVRGSTARSSVGVEPEGDTRDLMWHQVATLDAALAMSREFMSCRTVEEIVEKLAIALPLLGVLRGFLLLHGHPDDAESTVVLAVHDGTFERTTLDASLDLGRWFAHSREAYPSRGTLVVQPLTVGDVEIGQFVIEQAPRRDGYVAEALGIDLSRAIDTVNRTRRLEAEVAARREAQDALVFQAHHDPLTGLLDRAAFLDQVEASIDAADAAGVALLLVDVDRFKDVNDSLGHTVGNALLRRIAQRLCEVAGEDGLVGRLNGDAFTVMIPRAGSSESGLAAARRILAAMRDPFVLDGVTLEIDASVGIACAPLQGSTARALLHEADVAMQMAKAEHHGVAVFDPSRHLEAPRRLALFGELRRALAQDELVVHYQPITQVGTGTVTGLEALVRWQHPTRGLLPPAEFLEVAEQTGLIHPITSHVLDRSLADCRRWLDDGLSLRVAVNLSARRLTDLGLVEEVSDLLARHGVPATNLVLEVTESAAMADPHRALEVLTALRDLGIQLSVDDFGTGYASLAYLSRLPVSSLKIDREFVQKMESDQANMTIVRTILELARSLGLGVVAEGIETLSAYRALADYDGLKAQGFWLARPVPARDVPSVVLDIQRRLAEPDHGGPVPVLPQPRRPQDQEVVSPD